MLRAFIVLNPIYLYILAYLIQNYNNNNNTNALQSDSR